jgi:hypothetical protein
MPDAKDEGRIQGRIVAVHRDVARSSSGNYQFTAQRVAFATDERVLPEDGDCTPDPLDGGDGRLCRQLKGAGEGWGDANGTFPPSPPSPASGGRSPKFG